MKIRTRKRTIYLFTALFGAVMLFTPVKARDGCTLMVSSISETREHYNRVRELRALGYDYEVAYDQASLELEGWQPYGTGGIAGNSPSSTAGTTETPADTTPKHTHDWKFTTVKKATCQEEGEVYMECECGESKYEKQAKTDHNYEATSDEPATCIKLETVTFTCVDCGDSYTVEKGDYADHVYIETDSSEKPTCEKAGTITYECSVCHDTYTEEVEALGHDWDEEFTVDKKATCLEDGLKSIHCKRSGCDAVKEGSEVVIEKKGHVEDPKHTIVEPTFFTDGSETIICSQCREVMETKVLPKTGNMGLLIGGVVGAAVILGAGITAVVVAVRKKNRR